MKDLKKRKRATCGSISDSEYTYSSKMFLTTKTIKKMKEEFKQEKILQNWEKQNWEKEVKEILDKID